MVKFQNILTKIVGTKFQIKLTISKFWIKLTQKSYFRSKKVKNENHYPILHIAVSLCSKFQFQQTILIFWNKLTSS